MSNRFILNEFSYFGRGCRSELVPEIQKRGFKKILVVTDADLVKCGVAGKVVDLLEEADIEHAIYSDVKPNPTIENVISGVDVCKGFGADAIVTIGGGSAMDTAKGISILMTNPNRTMQSLNGLSNTENKGLPIIALPTTAGTASEVTINYVITDEERQIKMVCVDPNDLPIVAIVDSELMETMPSKLAAATGLDALTHAVEGYITAGHNLMSDMFHLEAIKLIFANLEAAVNAKSPEAMEKMSYAQYIAGMGFSNVGLGIVHSMAHQLGAVYDTPHGIANAMLLPVVMKFNGAVCADRFVEILNAIGVDTKGMGENKVVATFVEKIEALSKSVGVTQTIKDYGCKEEDIDMLSNKAMEDPCKPGNPREVSHADFVALYREAMNR
ncbi:MAG: lactaldehyde reductase [Clostridiales bacterium]|nr:lactaldehyde reductase [Clostridiales bacterium]